MLFENKEIYGDTDFKIKFMKAKLDSHYYFIPLYAEHRPAIQDILSGRRYEHATHSFFSKIFESREGSMIHAGTFFGDMLPDFSNKINGTLYAFEPLLENFVMAKMCIQENKLENCLIFNCALSNAITNLRINAFEESLEHAGGAAKISQDGLITSSIKIDSLNINDMFLLHLDIEGHELEALMGGINTIKKCMPIIAIEDNNMSCPDLLKSLDYQLYFKLPELDVWIHKNDYSAEELIDSI